MKNIFLVLTSLMLVSACTHKKVEVNNLNDKNLTCQQIAMEIGQIKELKSGIDEKTGISGRNVAMGLLFWPGIIVNEMNGSKAEELANERMDKLVSLHEQKSC